MAGLPEEEAKEYLQSFGIKEGGLSRLIKKSYEVLELISFFTFNEKETKAWTVKKGATAPVAAGKVHGDFQKNFIRAEVVNVERLLNAGGWTQAKERGIIKDRGKDYVVEDGDVIFFKVNVS